MDSTSIATLVVTVIAAIFSLLNGLKCTAKKTGSTCESSCTKVNKSNVSKPSDNPNG